MTCPKCQSENVNVQVVTVSKLKSKHSWLYWLTIGFLVGAYNVVIFNSANADI